MDDKLIQIQPEAILADDNIRYALTKADIEQMKSAIKEMGYITTPVDVEKLDKPVNGCTYRLTKGFRRHAAALSMNKDEGAGLSIPAIVRPLGGDRVLRLKHQLSENIDRKNLSPMDTAAAIKSLMDAGQSRIQVREIFKRPSGKKGTETQPASNAWLNMTLSFLDLPKEIRDKIHAGVVGVAAAYELTKVSPEKRAEVLEKAEASRQADLDREAKEEEKFLKAESKLHETTAAEEKVATELDLARAEVELADRHLETTNDAAADAYKKAKAAKGDARKAAEEHHKAVEADLKAAEKRQETAKKALDKLTDSKIKLSERAEGMRKHLAETRAGVRQGRAGRSKSDAVGSQEIKAAAKEAGENVGVVKLTGAQMRKTIEDLTLAGTFPKVALIGAAIKKCFDSVSTPGEMLKELAAITGEGKVVSKRK